MGSGQCPVGLPSRLEEDWKIPAEIPCQREPDRPTRQSPLAPPRPGKEDPGQDPHRQRRDGHPDPHPKPQEPTSGEVGSWRTSPPQEQPDHEESGDHRWKIRSRHEAREPEGRNTATEQRCSKRRSPAAQNFPEDEVERYAKEAPEEEIDADQRFVIAAYHGVCRPHQEDEDGKSGGVRPVGRKVELLDRPSKVDLVPFPEARWPRPAAHSQTENPEPPDRQPISPPVPPTLFPSLLSVHVSSPLFQRHWRRKKLRMCQPSTYLKGDCPIV